ncbi:hypothetical protein [Gemmata sp.]|uniref:hypothetical protein n=1 Tax=Gemmata sp. TaxID=1914242 RepID=UPI003F6F36E0
MTAGLIVRIPVTVAFGTDEEFDLRVRLERELGTALAAAGAGEGAGSETGTAHMSLHFVNITDAGAALGAAKDVLARAGLLARAEVVLETRSKADPDDPTWQVLWPVSQPAVARSA